MDREEHSSASDTTWVPTFLTLLVLTPLAAVSVIGVGLMSQPPSGFTSIPVVPWKPDCDDGARPRSSFGIREPGYGRTLD